VSDVWEMPDANDGLSLDGCAGGKNSEEQEADGFHRREKHLPGIKKIGIKFLEQFG
jgi:hypothetical protein